MNRTLLPLLRVQFKAMGAAFSRKNRASRPGGRGSIGSKVLFGLLYVYLIGVFLVLFSTTFMTLAEPFHQMGLDWFYFAMAGLIAFGLSVIGSVFMTQSQLYDAKDNDMLLSMPIPPSMILLSRMLPLYVFSMGFTALVLLPAFGVYMVLVQSSLRLVVLGLICLILLPMVELAFCSILGRWLHLLLQKLPKSAVSMAYLVIFLVCYFYLYSQANVILQKLTQESEAISASVKVWVWPLYAMGMGLTRSYPLFAGFTLFCLAVSGLVYWFLSVTFLTSAIAAKSGGRRRKLNLARVQSGSVRSALVNKELKRFLTSPTYLTNMGIGLLMVAALGIAGVIFREDVKAILPLFGQIAPLLVVAVVASTASMACISAPSVSMEGKNLWILRSMPVDGRTVLAAKLETHCLLVLPVTAIVGLALSVAFGLSLPLILLCTLVPVLTNLGTGILGLLTGVRWARFDWTSEAYPCKQAPSLLLSMFFATGLSFVTAVILVILDSLGIDPPATVTLSVLAALLIAMDALMAKALMGWGAGTWDTL